MEEQRVLKAFVGTDETDLFHFPLLCSGKQQGGVLIYHTHGTCGLVLDTRTIRNISNPLLKHKSKDNYHVYPMS